MKDNINLNSEEIKDATTNAIIAMQGCKFVVASITSEKDNKVIIHHECSLNQLALIIKGMLSMNPVLLGDVVSWGSNELSKSIENTKNSN